MRTHRPGEASSRRSEARLTLWIGLTAFWFFAVFNHGHFIGSDEVAIFEMTRSIAEKGELAVPALQHTAPGRDGRRYSFFSPGQSVLALPLYFLGDAAQHVLPLDWRRALRGPPNGYGPYVFGGTLAITAVGFFSTLASAGLIALFFRFERRLGTSRRSALIATGLLATSTYVLLMSTYFLRHASEALCLLGAFFLFFRYKESGRLQPLFWGAGLASLAFLLRVPNAFAAPALAAYLGWAIFVRTQRFGQPLQVLRAALIALIPLALALAIHAAWNQARWDDFFGSPMVDQYARLDNPIYIGLTGFLVSPGSSVFVYSPLLLLLPWTLPGFFRRWRAEASAVVGLAIFLLLVYSSFNGWEGLWSAPGPRYLFLWTPMLLLSLGPWLDRPGGARRSIAVGSLALVGLAVQVVSTVVQWGAVPALANYLEFEPRWSFLFVPQYAPIAEMTRLFLAGGPYDPWLIRLAGGWTGFEGQPALAVSLFVAWSAGLSAGLVAIHREHRRLGAGN